MNMCQKLRNTILGLKCPKLYEKYNNQSAVNDSDSVEVEELALGDWSMWRTLSHHLR
jgi:hypothetical protein